MNKIWTFGCSVMAGVELVNQTEDRFSKIVADKIGYDEFNFATGGASNIHIHRTILSKINKIEGNDKVVIMWSEPYRQEHKRFKKVYANGNVRKHVTQKEYPKLVPNKITVHNKAVDIFLENLYDENIAWSHSCQLYYSIYQLLLAKNIDFLFCFLNHEHFEYVFNNLEAENYYKDVVAMYTELYSSRYVNIFDIYFMDYCKQHNLRLGPGGHPLEECHKIYADLLLEHFDIT